MSTLKYGENNLHNNSQSHYNSKHDKQDRFSRPTSKSKYQNDQNGLINHKDSSRNKSNKEDKNDIPEEKYKVKIFEDWSEQVSRAGKKYYYNNKTEVSQWEKPTDWINFERRQYQQLKYNESQTVNDGKQKSVANDVVNHVMPAVASTSSNTESRSSFDYRRHHVPTNNRHSANNSNFIDYNSPSKRDNRHHAENVSNSGQNSYNKANVDTGSPHTSRSDSNRRGMKSGRNNESKRARYDNQVASTSGYNHASFDSRTAAQTFGKPAGVDYDPEKLPHLLAEIAGRENIDLADVNALEKIKKHLKVALRETIELEKTPPGTVVDCFRNQFSNQNGSATISKHSEHTNDTDNIPCFVDSDQQLIEVDLPLFAPFSASHAEFYRESLSCKIKDWAASHFENQANALSDRCFKTSLEVAQVSADLKCARSLVRTAEIRSTLVDQRVGYLQKQYLQLETLNKPASSTSILLNN